VTVPWRIRLLVRVVLAGDRDRHAAVAAQVLRLQPALGGVEGDEIAVEANPHGRHLRRAVGVEGRHVGHVLVLEEVLRLVGDCSHSESSWYVG
jgi:hypothetical protein